MFEKNTGKIPAGKIKVVEQPNRAKNGGERPSGEQTMGEETIGEKTGGEKTGGEKTQHLFKHNMSHNI